MFSVERGAFGFHEVCVAVMAVVALVSSGGVFSALDYVFSILSLIELTNRILTNYIHFASWPSHFPTKKSSAN